MNSGRIYVTEDKILCGTMDGSEAQLYPQSMDLNAYTTKEELEAAVEELKELIDVNAKIVGTLTFKFLEPQNIAVPECDFIEIEWNQMGASIDDIVKRTVIVYKGCKGAICTPGSSNVINSHEYELSADGTSLTIPESVDNFEYVMNIICYKYI